MNNFEKKTRTRIKNLIQKIYTLNLREGISNLLGLNFFICIIFVALILYYFYFFGSFENLFVLLIMALALISFSINFYFSSYSLSNS